MALDAQPSERRNEVNGELYELVESLRLKIFVFLWLSFLQCSLNNHIEIVVIPKDILNRCHDINVTDALGKLVDTIQLAQESVELLLAHELAAQAGRVASADLRVVREDPRSLASSGESLLRLLIVRTLWVVADV